MKRSILGFALVVGSGAILAQPSLDATKTCVKTESTSPRVNYIGIPANEINETEDKDSGRTETTIRFDREEMGTWEKSSSNAFGLVYNGKQIPLSGITRLSKEKPSRFDLSLARWGLISEGTKSFICISFNFEGLGQSGSFQNVRGVYLLDRKTRPLRLFYTVGRVTEKDVVLAK